VAYPSPLRTLWTLPTPSPLADSVPADDCAAANAANATVPASVRSSGGGCRSCSWVRCIGHGRHARACRYPALSVAQWQSRPSSLTRPRTPLYLHRCRCARWAGPMSTCACGSGDFEASIGHVCLGIGGHHRKKKPHGSPPHEGSRACGQCFSSAADPVAAPTTVPVQATAPRGRWGEAAAGADTDGATSQDHGQRGQSGG